MIGRKYCVDGKAKKVNMKRYDGDEVLRKLVGLVSCFVGGTLPKNAIKSNKELVRTAVTQLKRKMSKNETKRAC